MERAGIVKLKKREGTCEAKDPVCLAQYSQNDDSLHAKPRLQETIPNKSGRLETAGSE